MTARSALISFAALTLAGAVAFFLFRDLLSGAWFAFEVPPEIASHLELSRDDQKRLASLDPSRDGLYKGRHEELSELGRHLDVVSHNRERIVSRFQRSLLALVGGTLAVFALVAAARQHRDVGRLTRLGSALEQLSWGKSDVDLEVRGSDAIGRFAHMIETASESVARDRRRLEALENLSRWQESARRHAHEMRTPLTAARLELERLLHAARKSDHPSNREVEELAASIGSEIDRLADFTTRFTRFAKLPKPKPGALDLAPFIASFADTFADAWPGLTLEVDPESTAAVANADRGMLRQVLVNLCENSHQAGATRIALRAETTGKAPCLMLGDDGPGVDKAVAPRLFDPYVTSREVGEGMGLGLAISKKIMLDHGGDLELLASESGAVFRLTLRPPTEES